MAANKLVDPSLVDSKFWSSWPHKFTSVSQYEARKEKQNKVKIYFKKTLKKIVKIIKSIYLFQPKTRADELKQQHMGTKLKRQGSPTPSTSTSTPKRPRPTNAGSDSDFVTEDEEVNIRLETRKQVKAQNSELFTQALRDLGVNKTMEKAAG